jgi:hypothetical protein
MKISLHLIKLLIFQIFMILFVVSFYLPLLHKNIMYVQFFIVSILIYMLSQKNNFDRILIVWLLLTLILAFFGLPGSAFGYLSSAIIGIFSAIKLSKKNNINSRIETISFVMVAVIYIFSCIFLFGIDLSNDDMGNYFGIASINYASLTIAAFGSIFTTYCIKCKYNDYPGGWRMENLTRVIAILLSLCILVAALIFETRSVLLSFIPPLIYALKLNSKRIFVLSILLISFVVFLYEKIIENLITLIVPGRNNLLDLYDSELKKDSERAVAIIESFENILPKLGFCFDCSMYMSYSGLVNLINFTFPFSLFLVYMIVNSFVFLFRGLILKSNIPKDLNLILFFNFMSTFLVTILQPDFLSIISLFYIIGSVTALNATKKRIVIGFKTSESLRAM